MNSRARTRERDEAATLSALSSWETQVDKAFIWMPYVLLAISLGVAQFGSKTFGNRLIEIGLAVAAAGWTWVTFTRKGRPSTIGQGALQVYFIGFVFLALLLVLRSPVFLVYGLTGLFHASLLRPWPVAFVGIGAASLVVHAHIVITESTPATWAIYLGIAILQTVAVSAGLYGGHRISEVAEERRETLERLERMTRENEGLHAQLVAQAREAGVLDERQRMAREIHDTIAQGLTGVITQLEAVEQAWDDAAEVHRRLATATDLARHSLDEARRSVQAIRPGPLSDSKLPKALRGVATRWSDVYGIPVLVSTAGQRRSLHPEIEVVLLRAAQEGLANVAKHAAATQVGITLTFMDGTVALDVRDNGAGFEAVQAGNEESFGLAAMQQRVHNISGEVTIESTPGEGTAISVRVPTARLPHE
jgi:signal transduction histidine kinase